MKGEAVAASGMRVAHFAGNFLPQLGGAELSIHEMVRAQRERHADARVLAPTVAARGRIAFPYPVVEFPKSRLYSNRFWAYGALTSLYSRWRFDVIHLQVTLPHAPWTLEWRRMLGLRSRVKVVITAAGSDLNVLPEIGYGEFMVPANRERALKVLRDADLLMPTSSTMADRMIELDPSAESKIVVIPRGCAVDRLHNARRRRDDARRRFGIAPDRFVVISVGRAARVKNYEFLVEVIAAAVAEIPEITLLSVGERDPALLAMAERAGIAERLIFTGRFPPKEADPNLLLDLPHEGMVDAIAASDVGVLTSFVESYNNAAAEQGAAGLPLILTQRHGVKDRVPDEFSSFILDDLDLASFVDALKRLRDQPGLCEAYGAGMRASIASVTHDAIAARQLAAYRALFDGGRNR